MLHIQVKIFFNPKMFYTEVLKVGSFNPENKENFTCYYTASSASLFLQVY